MTGMHVSVVLRHCARDAMSSFAERRVRLAFGRFGTILRRARVDLFAGPGGGGTCRLLVYGTGAVAVAVSECADSESAALQAAIETATRELVAQLRKGRALSPRRFRTRRHDDSTVSTDHRRSS